jgi:hypothetical protein
VGNGEKEPSEDWIEIEETFEPARPETDLLVAFQRRYGPTLWDTPWESTVKHAPGCASLAGPGACDCDVEVHVTQPTLRRRIRLRWLPNRRP